MPVKAKDFYAYRNICIKHDLFRGGTNEQYDKVFRLMSDGGITLQDLTLLTWFCSYGFLYSQVQELLKPLFTGR